MLSRLTVLIETSLKFTSTSGDYEATKVGQRRTHDHVGHVVFVAWSIEDRKLLRLSVDAGSSHFDSFTFCLLFVGTVHDVGEPPRISTLILRFFFKFLNRPLVNYSHRVNQIAANC